MKVWGQDERQDLPLKYITIVCYTGNSMSILEKIYKQVLADICRTKRYSLLLLLVACSWSYLAGVAYLTNAFGYYPLNKLLKAVVLLPVIYILLAWVVGHFILAPQKNIKQAKITYFAVSMLSALYACLLLSFHLQCQGLLKCIT